MADKKVTVIARIKAKPGMEETVKNEVLALVDDRTSAAGQPEQAHPQGTFAGT